METPITQVTRTKEEARANYNRLSRWYDTVAGSTEKKYRDIGLQQLNAQPGEHILEIGFGTGHCLLSLACAVGPTGHIVGIDLSDGMLAIAQNRLQNAAVADRVTLIQGDALQQSLPALSFDAIFMSFTLELFDTPEIPQLLQKCHTLLKANGRIALVTMVKKPATAVSIYEWFHQKMPTVVDCRPIHAQPAIQEAGFTLQNSTALSMWGLPVEIILASK
jgi:demethylmenaquinone methyltransferase/2-methoxy-6-polyprenyl-1,4-benzoquinol methylase